MPATRPDATRQLPSAVAVVNPFLAAFTIRNVGKARASAGWRTGRGSFTTIVVTPRRAPKSASVRRSVTPRQADARRVIEHHHDLARSGDIRGLDQLGQRIFDRPFVRQYARRAASSPDKRRWNGRTDSPSPDGSMKVKRALPAGKAVSRRRVNDCAAATARSRSRPGSINTPASVSRSIRAGTPDVPKRSSVKRPKRTRGEASDDGCQFGPLRHVPACGAAAVRHRRHRGRCRKATEASSNACCAADPAVSSPSPRFASRASARSSRWSTCTAAWLRSAPISRIRGSSAYRRLPASSRSGAAARPGRRCDWYRPRRSCAGHLRECLGDL